VLHACSLHAARAGAPGRVRLHRGLRTPTAAVSACNC
jgi:hypothetical protein